MFALLFKCVPINATNLRHYQDFDVALKDLHHDVGIAAVVRGLVF